jgi:hypothetical protein
MLVPRQLLHLAVKKKNCSKNITLEGPEQKKEERIRREVIQQKKTINWWEEGYGGTTSVKTANEKMGGGVGGFKKSHAVRSFVATLARTSPSR